MRSIEESKLSAIELKPELLQWQFRQTASQLEDV